MVALGLAAVLAGAWILFLAGGRDAPGPPGGAEGATSAVDDEFLADPRPEKEPGSGVAVEQGPDENAGAEEKDSPSTEVFRGRVVDAATGEPVGYARMVAGELQAQVDENGFFVASGPLAPDTEHIEFHNDVQSSHIRTIDRAALESTSEGSLARIAIGPTYRLDIWRVSRAELGDWRARLVEIRLDGREAPGDFLRLYPADPPFLRLDNPWEMSAPESSFRVDVMNALGTRMGSSDLLDSAVGIFPGIVSVQIDREFARVSGRVVTEVGTPVEAAVVQAVSELAFNSARDGWSRTTTDESGRFELSGLSPETYDILIHPVRGEPVARQLFLPPGELTLDDFVVTLPEIAGEIRGRLESSRPVADAPRIRLRAVDGRAFSWFDHPSADEFHFGDVPVGEYELSVLSTDGYRWSPSSVRVSPPADELVFVREDDVPLFGLALELWDAETDAPIEEFWVHLQIGALWNREPRLVRSGESFAEIPDGARFRFSVHAAGYEPAYGGDENFTREGSLRTATLELEPGWGARFLMRDLGHGFDNDDPEGRAAVLERPRIADIEVWADGERVATSDEQGIALVSLSHEPDELTFVSPFWRMVGSDHLQRGRLAGEARDAIVWFVRE